MPNKKTYLVFENECFYSNWESSTCGTAKFGPRLSLNMLIVLFFLLISLWEFSWNCNALSTLNEHFILCQRVNHDDFRKEISKFCLAKKCGPCLYYEVLYYGLSELYHGVPPIYVVKCVANCLSVVYCTSDCSQMVYPHSRFPLCILVFWWFEGTKLMLACEPKYDNQLNGFDQLTTPPNRSSLFRNMPEYMAVSLKWSKWSSLVFSSLERSPFQWPLDMRFCSHPSGPGVGPWGSGWSCKIGMPSHHQTCREHLQLIGIC